MTPKVRPMKPMVEEEGLFIFDSILVGLCVGWNVERVVLLF